MKDVSEGDDVVVIVLDREGWLELFEAFDDQARVVEIDVVTGALSAAVDIPVKEWGWPSPASSCVVTVRQPDPSSFRMRLASIGKELVSEEPVAGSDLVEDDHTMVAGVVVEGPCKSCGYPELVVEDLRIQSFFIEAVAYRRGFSYSFTPCDDHGGHCRLNGEEAYLVRCCDCLEMFVWSEVLPSAMVHVSQEH